MPEISATENTANPSPAPPPKKAKRKSKKNRKPISEKRYVNSRKFYLTDEEETMLRSKIGSPVSFSNCIRYNLGLSMNTPGRKRKNTEAAFDVDSLLEDE